MPEFKIDDGVAMPAELRRTTWPFGRMAPGQSFFAGGDPRRARGAADAYAKKHGMIFRIRTVTENDVKGYRVWRVS